MLNNMAHLQRRCPQMAVPTPPCQAFTHFSLHPPLASAEGQADAFLQALAHFSLHFLRPRLRCNALVLDAQARRDRGICVAALVHLACPRRCSLHRMVREPSVGCGCGTPRILRVPPRGVLRRHDLCPQLGTQLPVRSSCVPHSLLPRRLQGIQAQAGSRQVYTLTDAAIASQGGRYGRADLGPTAIAAFFSAHTCSDVCRRLARCSAGGEGSG